MAPKRFKYLFPLLVTALFISACVSEPKVDPNSPEGLFKLGKFYEEQERFEEAIQQYKTLSNKFPYNKLATEAELHVADSYYKKDEFIEAAASYKTFKELHPKHAQIDYVTFRAAESLREQLPRTVDKDITQAAQAIGFYEEVVNVYPTSKYTPEAKEKRLKLIQMLADKEIYIADFYYGQEKYLSSLTRYELFLQTYPQNRRVPYVLLGAARSAQRIKEKDKVRQFVDQLVSNYPGTDEAKLAKREFPNAAR